MAQFFGEEGSEFYAPFAEGLVEEWRPHGRPFTTMLTSINDVSRPYAAGKLGDGCLETLPDSVGLGPTLSG